MLPETVVNVKTKRVKCRNRLFETQASFQNRQFRPRVRGIGCVWGTNRGKSEGVCTVLGTALDTVFWWKDKAGNESFIIYLVARTANHLPGGIHFTVHSCGWFRIKRNSLCLSSATHTWFLAGRKGTAPCQLETQDLAAGLRRCLERFQAVSLSLPSSADSPYHGRRVRAPGVSKWVPMKACERLEHSWWRRFWILRANSLRYCRFLQADSESTVMVFSDGVS